MRSRQDAVVIRYPGIAPCEGDALEFVAAVNDIIAGLVSLSRPSLVVSVRVKNWFDHKWLRYSGKGLVSFDPPWPSHPGVALAEFSADQLTFPPFAPSRVVAELAWRRDASGNYVAESGGPRIHRRRRGASARNLQHRVLDAGDSAVFVWTSTGSEANSRGSVMAYTVNAEGVMPWFIAFAMRSSGWELGEVKGVGRREVEGLLSRPSGPRPGTVEGTKGARVR